MARSEGPFGTAPSLTARVVLLREAELDLAGIEDWYESHQAGLGTEFREAFDDLLRRIGENPHASPERYRGNRRAILRRFPYVVWYRSHEDSVVILACVHGRRDPRLAHVRLENDLAEDDEP